MRLTNEKGLPEPIVQAMMNDSYSRGESDFTVTELISPARQAALKIKHYDDLVEDASDRVWSFFGQISHGIVERLTNKNYVSEKRFYSTINGFKVGGQIDLYDIRTATLYDIKTTSAWAFIEKNGGGRKKEYEQQLNMLAYLLRENGLEVNRIAIIGILRDHDEKCLDPINKRYYREGYPKTALIEVGQLLWTNEDARKFLEIRVEEHSKARELLKAYGQDKMPLCPKEDLWGGRRCKSYCSVNEFCDQYKQIKTRGVIDEV